MPRSARDSKLLQIVVSLFKTGGCRYTPADVVRVLEHSSFASLDEDALRCYCKAATMAVGPQPLFSAVARKARLLRLPRPPSWEFQRVQAEQWYQQWNASERSTPPPSPVPPHLYEAAVRSWRYARVMHPTLQPPSTLHPPSVPPVGPLRLPSQPPTTPPAIVLKTGVGSTHVLELDPTTRQGGVLQHGCQMVLGSTRHTPRQDGAVELLDEHPNPCHPANIGCVGRPRVLAERHAALLLTDGRVDPCGPDVQRRIATAPPQARGHHGPDGGFTRALSVRWSALDTLGVARGWWRTGEPLERMKQLRTKWLATQPTQQEASGTQGASGLYSEVGMSAMAGGGRRSFLANAHWCRTPFEGDVAKNDALEEPLAGMAGVVTGALREWWPEVLDAMHAHAHASAASAALACATQYPRPWGSEEAADGCQVALRSTATDAGSTSPFHSGSDLHTDPMDGRFGFGSWAAYACWEEGQRLAPGVRDHPNPYSDVAVLPTSHGGEGGVRWQTMHPDFFTILMMDTQTCLHGSVFPDDPVAAAARLPTGLQTVRAIHYPLRDIQTAIECVGRDPASLHALCDALADQGPVSERLLLRLQTEMAARGL